MSPELRVEMVRILERLVNGEPGDVLVLNFRTPPNTIDVVKKLEGIGAVWVDKGHVKVTAQGLAYLQEWKPPGPHRRIQQMLRWAARHAWAIAVPVIAGLILAFLLQK